MRPGVDRRSQDAAPYNAVMDGDRLVGFFDWDMQRPGVLRGNKREETRDSRKQETEETRD
jgi:hypothetical protein